MYYIDYICFRNKYNVMILDTCIRKIKFCYRLQYECRVSVRQNDGKIISIGLDMIHLAIDIRIFL